VAHGGCQIGPIYDRPKLDTANHWREAVNSAIFPDKDWWKSFRSDELDQLIDRADKANFDIIGRSRSASSRMGSRPKSFP
jgi:outer membrane protein TolC